MLKQIIKKIFKKTIDDMIAKEICNHDVVIKQQKSIQHINLFKLEFPIGQKIVIRSNEWDDLIIGKIINYEIYNEETIIPVVEDIVSGKLLMCNGIMRKYSVKLIEMLMHHNPFEQYMLMDKTGYGDSIINKKTKVNENIKTYDEIVEIIEKNNF